MAALFIVVVVAAAKMTVAFYELIVFADRECGGGKERWRERQIEVKSTTSAQ